MSRRKRQQRFERLEVFDAGAKGKALAKAPDGRVIFLSDAVPGDIVDVETFRKRKGYYEGRTVHYHKLSERRVEPKCMYFGVCGGCKWQHMGYEHQLYFKQKEVENNLRRIGKVELPETSPIIGSQKTFFYRNKMEFSFSDNRWITQEELASGTEITERNALGFHIPGKWDKILDIDHCWLQEDPSNAIRNSIREFAIRNELSFFNTREKRGLLRTLMIRTSSIGQIMVLIQFFEEDRESIELLMNHIVKSFPGLTSLLYVINQKANDTIYDQEVFCFHGSDHIIEEMEGLRFKINAKSFYQTNSEQAYELYKVARDFAGLSGSEIVYDLYTGTGTIAQFIASSAKQVIGVDSVPEAIEAANDNAQFNNISNVKFLAGDMKQVFNEKFISSNGRADVVITDPPRDGMHKAVVNQLASLAADRIVYVSCNSATQARDLQLLDETYRVTRVQPVDMFPQTHHVENVVLLEKR